MQQTAAESSAKTISRLADVAARLRRVRQAQRRFLKLWAEQRATAWTRELFCNPDRGDARSVHTPRFKRFDD